MLYLVLIVVGFFAMGIIDVINEAYKETDDYKELMDNYYSDCRKLQKI